MPDPRDLDDLLAQAERVDEPPRTARRAVGLTVTLVGVCLAIALGALGGFRGLVIAVLWFASLGSVPTGS